MVTGWVRHPSATLPAVPPLLQRPPAQNLDAICLQHQQGLFDRDPVQRAHAQRRRRRPHRADRLERLRASVTPAPSAVAPWPRTLVGDGITSAVGLPSAGRAGRSEMAHFGAQWPTLEREYHGIHACAGTTEERHGRDNIGQPWPERCLGGARHDKQRHASLRCAGRGCEVPASAGTTKAA